MSDSYRMLARIETAAGRGAVEVQIRADGSRFVRLTGADVGTGYVDFGISAEMATALARTIAHADRLEAALGSAR